MRLNGINALPPYLRRKDAAAFLTISVSYLDKLTREGRGPICLLLGGKIPVFPVAGLKYWARKSQTRNCEA
jgi:hypothetical protein